MNSCVVCDREVTRQMVRQGGAISSGADYYHRDCYRSERGGTRPSASPVRSAAPAATGAYAGFWRRLGAHVIDGFILNIVVFIASLPLGLTLSAADPTAGGLVGAFIGLVLPLVYFLWFWSKKGATPGKIALGVRIVGPDGGPPSAGQSFVRYLGYIVSSLFFCLGFLWMLWDGERRTWHDMMAGTRVLRV